MAAGDAHWKVGVINTPGSTGTVAYTGFGGTPKAVFFWTTNFTAEDTIVTSAGSTVGRGMAGMDGASILQFASSLSVSGHEHVSIDSAVYCLASNLASTRYRANLDSFDSDGFTLDWTTANSGHKLVYAALMDVANSAAFDCVDNTTEALGWKAGASLIQGVWDGPNISGGTRNQEFFGGAAYPTSSGANWMGAGLTSFSFPTAPGGGQYNIGIFDQNPTSLVAQDGNFIGPSLTTQNVTAFPSGGGLTDFTLDTNTTDNYAMAVVWDDESSATGRSTPSASTSGVVNVVGFGFDPGFLTGYSISNEPQTQASGDARAAVGFSVVAPGFQWSCLIDRDPSAAAYQSFSRGVIDALNSTQVHAAEVELVDDGFTITTQEDDTTAQSWVWHVFGHPDREHMWTPHIYRRMVAA